MVDDLEDTSFMRPALDFNVLLFSVRRWLRPSLEPTDYYYSLHLDIKSLLHLDTYGATPSHRHLGWAFLLRSLVSLRPLYLLPSELLTAWP